MSRTGTGDSDHYVVFDVQASSLEAGQAGPAGAATQPIPAPFSDDTRPAVPPPSPAALRALARARLAGARSPALLAGLALGARAARGWSEAQTARWTGAGPSTVRAWHAGRLPRLTARLGARSLDLSLFLLGGPMALRKRKRGRMNGRPDWEPYENNARVALERAFGAIPYADRRTFSALWWRAVAARTLDVDVADLIGPSRRAPLVGARRALARLMHGAGFGPSWIGTVLRRDHSTVCYMVRGREVVR